VWFELSLGKKVHEISFTSTEKDGHGGPRLAFIPTTAGSVKWEDRGLS
jgi:hypothetical protein